MCGNGVLPQCNSRSVKDEFWVCVIVEIKVRVTQDHRKWHHSIDRIRVIISVP